MKREQHEDEDVKHRLSMNAQGPVRLLIFGIQEKR